MDVHVLIAHILLRISFLRSIMYILLHTSTLRAYSIAPVCDGTYSTVYIFLRIFHYAFICIACVRCSLIQFYTLISRILYVCFVIQHGVHVLIMYTPLFLLLLTSTVILYSFHVYSTAPDTPALLSHTDVETPIAHMFPHASLCSLYFVFIYPMVVILCLFIVYAPLICMLCVSVHFVRSMHLLVIYCIIMHCILFFLFTYFWEKLRVPWSLTARRGYAGTKVCNRRRHNYDFLSFFSLIIHCLYHVHALHFSLVLSKPTHLDRQLEWIP